LDAFCAGRHVFFQEISESDVSIAEKFGCSHSGSAKNLGVCGGFLGLMHSLKRQHAYVMFLEDDFFLVGDVDAEAVLEDAKELIQEGVDVVKMRHRRDPGDPLWSRPSDPRTKLSEDFPYQLESAHWLDAPEEMFPNTLKRRDMRSTWYSTKSPHQRWSNNAFMCRLEWMLEAVVPILESGMDPSASDFMYQQMENILDRKLEFSAAAGPGLFKHERIG
jgi:hypothetical protein